MGEKTLVVDDHLQQRENTGAHDRSDGKTDLRDAQTQQQDLDRHTDLGGGRQEPIGAVATPTSTAVTARVRRRPKRSPLWPHTPPPTGRTTNPTAKVAKLSRVPTKLLVSGKNSVVKTGLTAVTQRVA